MSFLSETQERALRAKIDELPARRALPSIYPAPRVRGAVTLPSGRVIQPPAQLPNSTGQQVRIFPFHHRANASTRSSISSPLLIGPFLIKDWYWSTDSTTQPPGATFEIGNAPAAVTENDVALTIPRPYTPRLELQRGSGAGASNTGTGILNWSRQSGFSVTSWPLDILVTDARGAVVVAIINTSISVIQLDGWIRVIENYNPATAAPF